MIYKIFKQTVREALRFRYLGVLLISLAVAWFVFCITMTIFFNRTLDIKELRLWDLRQHWLNDPISQGEYYYSFINQLNPEEHREKSWRRYISLSFRSSRFLFLTTTCLLAAVISSMMLNLLFRREELSLYLARPLDRLQLFTGRFFGIYAVLLFFLFISHLLTLAGALGPQWRSGLEISALAFRLEAGILLGAVALSFCLAPTVGALMRGAGTFVGTVFFMFAATQLPTAMGGWHNLFPYPMPPNAPLQTSLLVGARNVFLLFVPRLFASYQAFVEILDNVRGESALPLPALLTINVQDWAGNWWWTVGTSAALFALAAVIWHRKEV